MSFLATSDVVIIGGGVIGLSIAYVLAGEGVSCTLLERGELGQEASWAGAGIISPGSEKPSRLPSAQLRTLSANLHEEWSRSLKESTGIDNGYRRSGGVDVALDDHDAAELRSSAGRWRDEGISHERLEPKEFSRVEPALGPRVKLAYFLPDRAQIRNPRHLRALGEASQIRGATLLPQTAVESLILEGSRVTGVRTASGNFSCGQLIVAAGAWSESLLKTIGEELPTPPIRGQIVLFHPERPLLRRIVEHGTRYLVPRDDGRVLAGSTEEYAGFDRSTTEEGIRGLIEFAETICPVLRGVTVEKTWAGLRPGSLDRRPTIGPMAGWDNLIIATGHQRSGLQLSPGTAALVSDFVLGRTPRIDTRPFASDRPPSESRDEAFRS